MNMHSEDRLNQDETLYGLIEWFGQQAQWDPLRISITRNCDFVSWITPDQANGISSIVCQAGHGAKHLGEEDLDTEFNKYIQQVITPLSQAGTIRQRTEEHPFDDRKVRWSDIPRNVDIDSTKRSLTLSVGPTHYGHCRDDIQRTKADSIRRMTAGIERYQDPYRYFARGMGVVVIPLTVNGHTVIGSRSQTQDYQGLLSFVSGWATFSTNANQINFFDDARNELREEIRLYDGMDELQIKFVGLAGQPISGETDLVFVAQTELDDDYFGGEDWPEHQSWIVLRSANDAIKLLNASGSHEPQRDHSKVMFSSQFGLEYLINHYWTS